MNEMNDPDALSEDELEAAYRQAIEASEAAEETVALHEAEPVAAEKPAAATRSSASAPPERVIEAALFVGGEGLTPSKLASMLELEAGDEQVARWVQSVNDRYDRQGRPYEVRLREGEYRMQLRREFEPVRDRLYGRAPKEVTLPPDVIVLLSVIAYEQPVGPERLGKVGVPGWKSALKQLRTRGLIDTTDDGYVTTDRFLDVFGLRELEEMPRPEDLIAR